MAVVLIMALAAALIVPNTGALRGSRLKDRALEVAGRIELARELAIVTGVPHRMMIHLETGEYDLDWWVTEERAKDNGSEDEEEEDEIIAEVDSSEMAEAAAYDNLDEIDKISLDPPKKDVRDYYPIPSRFGQRAQLPEDFFFEAINTPEGWIDDGSVQLVFQWDGTSDFAEIILGDAWGNTLTLEIQPLLETVRIRQDDEDS